MMQSSGSSSTSTSTTSSNANISKKRKTDSKEDYSKTKENNNIGKEDEDLFQRKNEDRVTLTNTKESWLTKEQSDKLALGVGCHSTSLELPYNYSDIFYSTSSELRSSNNKRSTAASSKKPIAKKSEVPPPHLPAGSCEMYGKLIPSCWQGSCCFCSNNNNVTSEEEGAPEELIECPTCLRQFHKTCYVKDKQPLLVQDLKQTICPFCDPLDTSSHLIMYFEKCNEARANFESSYDYVLHTINREIQLEKDKLLLAEKQQYQAPPLVQDTAGKGGRTRNNSNTKQPVAVSDNSVGNNNVNIQLPESEFDCIDYFAPYFWKSKTEFFKTRSETRPGYLVGKSVHLYCPLDNTYHIGRVIDWRKARPFMKLRVDATDKKCEFYGNGQMKSCEFLVRFKAGVNGRKRSVHEWIILEEHSLAVGLDIVWGDNKDKNKTTSKNNRNKKNWMPAVTFIRSAREIGTDIENILTSTTTSDEQSPQPDDENRTVVCLFLGEDMWAFPRIKDEIADFKSPLFDSNKNHPASRNIQLAVALARVEAMEQNQVLQWHRMANAMPCAPITQSSSLSILDNDTLPLLFVSPSRDSEDEPNNTNCSILKSSYHQQYPRMCHQISAGLDRLWLARLAGLKEGTTSDIGTIKTMAFEILTSPVGAMAAVNKKHLQEANHAEKIKN